MANCIGLYYIILIGLERLLLNAQYGTTINQLGFWVTEDELGTAQTREKTPDTVNQKSRQNSDSKEIERR